MANLTFSVRGARVEPFAAVPTLCLQLGIEETTGQAVHTLALRCQIQIEPQKRPYGAAEKARLLELFGEPARWGETLKPLLWTHASAMVPGFSGSTEIELPVTCTYDFEVTSAKYFQGLDDGEIPLLLLFSGTVFAQGGPGSNGLAVERVPWDKEVAFRLPVSLWREVMDRYFPGSVWIRLQRESFDALLRFKGERALPTFEETLAVLLAAAGETPS
jgi:hypothetical protein